MHQFNEIGEQNVKASKIEFGSRKDERKCFRVSRKLFSKFKKIIKVSTHL